MFEQLLLQKTMVKPALFLAPMAGITHSAFRRLVAGFGGYGALFTEMLSGEAILRENMNRSPFTRRRECEGLVVYQLLLSGSESTASIMEHLRAVRPEAIDLNLGCFAPAIRKRGGGVSLFVDMERLSRVLDALRMAWSGILTVKCRLGHDPDLWQGPFEQRLRLFEQFGVDALHVHLRFFDEKFKRVARKHLLRWIVNHTKIPVIANGDITADILNQDHQLQTSGVRGAMLGRMVVVKPWIFLECAGYKPKVDYAEVWERFYGYVMEDFPPERAIGRIKEFSAYYARNFFYSHEFFKAVQNALTLDEAYTSAMGFLSKRPRIVSQPSVAGI